ncbi:transposase, MuDR, MULE transposase domain protein [Tanacetum coccineum]
MHCLRPLLIIDAAHLKGQYKGINLVAVGIDGNNQIVPVAFVICKGETCPCWSWWMSVLKECIGDSPNLLFISDKHAAIALAVHNEFPLPFHVAIQPDAYYKLIQVGPQRWSRAHCPLVHYNYMTSNSVESVNACTVLYRKLPVLKLAETYRAMVQEWYFKRQELTVSKRRAFWSLNEDILKITILKTNTPYPSRKTQRIRACTHQRPQRNKAQYAVSRRPIRRIGNMESILYSRRYQVWSLL